MELAIIVLNQTVTMFILMAIGYTLYKLQIISNHCSKELSRMLISVVIPAVIVKSYAVEFCQEKLYRLGMACLAAVVALATAIVISFVLYGDRQRIENFSASFSNAGFVGIPLVLAVLGQEAVFYVSIYVALLNLLQQTYGVMIMTHSTAYIKPKKVATNPILVSLVIGLALFFMPIQLPGILSDCIGYVAGLNTPVAMLVLGIYLAQADIRDIITSWKLYLTSAVRLLLIPMVTICVLLLLPIPADIKMIELIAAATPIGSNVAVFAQLHNLDYGYAAKLVCNSTILSIAVLPAVVWIASTLF